MRTLVLVIASVTALAACGNNAATDTTLSENDTVEDGLESGVEAGANSFTEDQARNRLISMGYAAPTTMTMTESGAWRAVTRDPSGNAVTVLIDYRGNVVPDNATGPAQEGGVPPTTPQGSESNPGPGQSSPAPSGGTSTNPG